MKTRFVSGFLTATFISLLLQQQVASAEANLAQNTALCKTMYKEIWEHSIEKMNALEAKTGYFYWGRARVAIDATPNDVLEKTFKNMSRADLNALFWATKTGEAKVTRDEAKMIEELKHMVDDLGERPFWGDVPDRGFAIREAIRLNDAKHSFSSDPAYAAQLIDQGLGSTETEALARALSEHEKNSKYPNSKWYDRIVRFFSPHHDKVKTILEADNSIRHRLKDMYLARVPARVAIDKYASSLTPDEVKKLQGLVSGTADDLADVQKDVVNLFGREVSSSKPLPEAEMRIRDLAKRAEALKKEDKVAALTEKVEGDLDTVDSVTGAAWNRAKKTNTGLPVSEKTDEHLLYRNPQYRRETPEKRAVYLGVTETRSPEKSQYNVTTEWTVTVNHEEPKTRTVTKYRTNDKGEQESYTEIEHYTDYYTTSYSMSRGDVLKARYEEALANHVNPNDHISDLPSLPSAEPRGAYAVSASNGSPSIGSYDSGRVAKILEGAKGARSSENPYRSQIAHVTEVVDGVTNDVYKGALKKPGESEKIVKTLETEKSGLVAERDKLVGYQKLTSDQIKKQWPDDKPSDFADRNQQMINRFNHMITRVDHLAEQVRRKGPSLQVEYTEPNYPQLDRLNEIKGQNKRIIVRTSVGTTAAGATAGAAYGFRDEIMGYIRDLTGKGDDRRKNDPYYKSKTGY